MFSADNPARATAIYLFMAGVGFLLPVSGFLSQKSL
jgi:hypothetical protein